MSADPRPEASRSPAPGGEPDRSLVPGGAGIARLWLGQLASGIGDRLHVVAVMWIAVEAVGERAGWVAAAGPTAQLVLGLFGGVFADRLDKRRAMIAADVARALAVATLAIAGAFGDLSLWHLAGVGFVLGAFDSLFQPALRASLPVLAPDPDALQRANAWFEMTQRMAAVVGPPLTGVLLGVMAIEAFFAVDAATFAASAVAVAALGRHRAWRAARSDTAVRRQALGEIRGALRLVRANRPVAWSIGLVAVWNVASASAMVVGLPLLAKEVLGGGPELYGYLMGAYGVGNVLSNLWLVWHPVRSRLPVMFGGGLVWALGFVGVGLAPDVPTALACCAVAAVGGPLADVVRALLIQTEFPPDQIGKVYSLRVTVAKSTSGLGLVLAAPLFALAGTRIAIAASAGVVAFASVCALCLVAFRPDWRHGPAAGKGRPEGG